MNEPEASAVETLTPTIAQPLPRIGAAGSRRRAAATKMASATKAKNARPATCVPRPTWSSRCSTPAVDQARAARATYVWPRRCCDREMLSIATDVATPVVNQTAAGTSAGGLGRDAGGRVGADDGEQRGGAGRVEGRPGVRFDQVERALVR